MNEVLALWARIIAAGKITRQSRTNTDSCTADVLHQEYWVTTRSRNTMLQWGVDKYWVTTGSRNTGLQWGVEMLSYNSE